MTRLRSFGASAGRLRGRACGASATQAHLRPFGATAWQARPRRSGTAARQARLRLLLLVVGLGLLVRPAAAQTEVIEYYGHDALGSIRIVFTASGVATVRADFEPFGEAVTIAGMPAGPLPAQQFTGQERDALERQDYFGARYYRPRHGRFSQVDPVYAGLFDPQQWNRYAYARNNPLSFVDPDGRVTCRIVKVNGEDRLFCHSIVDGLFPTTNGGGGGGSERWTRVPREDRWGIRPPGPTGPPTERGDEDNRNGNGNDNAATNSDANNRQHTGDDAALQQPAAPPQHDCSFTSQWWRHVGDTNRAFPGMLAPSGLSIGLNATETVNRSLFRIEPHRPYGVLNQFRNVPPTVVQSALRLGVAFFMVGAAYEAGVAAGAVVSTVVYSCR